MRIVWYVRKYMDLSLDTGTWVNMARHLSDEDEVVLVSGYRNTPKQFGDDVRVRYLRSVRLPGLNLLVFSFFAALDMVREMRAGRADIVLVDAYLVPPALLARTVRGLFDRRTRFVLDVRTLPVETGRSRDRLDRFVFSILARIGARRLDGLTTITEPLAQVLAVMTGIPVSEMGIWTSGVDTALYDPHACAQKGDSYPEADDRSEHAPRFIYHGALLTKRGVDQAIRAVAVLRDRGVAVSLLLVGGGIDVAYLDRLIVDQGLGDRVRIEPPVDQVQIPALICASDFGLIPFPDLECWRVSSPLKLLEYLSMQIPVVATPLVCNTCVVGSASYIEWAAASDAEDLADAMMTAIGRSAEMRVAAEAGRRLVESGYTWTVQASKLRAYLAGVVDPECRRRVDA